MRMIAWQTNDSITSKWNSPCSFLLYFYCNLQCLRRVRADFHDHIRPLHYLWFCEHSKTWFIKKAHAFQAFIIVHGVYIFGGLINKLICFRRNNFSMYAAKIISHTVTDGLYQLLSSRHPSLCCVKTLKSICWEGKTITKLTRKQAPINIWKVSIMFIKVSRFCSLLRVRHAVFLWRAQRSFGYHAPRRHDR